jgi:hypothetical protein
MHAAGRDLSDGWLNGGRCTLPPFHHRPGRWKREAVIWRRAREAAEPLITLQQQKHWDLQQAGLAPETNRGDARLDRPHSEIAPWSIWISYSPDLCYWGQSQLIMRPAQYHWDEMKIGPGAQTRLCAWAKRISLIWSHYACITADRQSEHGILLPRLQESLLEDLIYRRIRKGPGRVPEMQQQERRAALVWLYRHHVEKERVNVSGCTYALRYVFLQFHPNRWHQARL